MHPEGELNSLKNKNKVKKYLRKFRMVIAAAIVMICLPMAFTSCQKDDGQTSTTAHLRYHFASQEEGRQLKMANTAYFDCLNQNDLDWKTWHSGATLAEYKAFAEEQIVGFTEEEKQVINSAMDFVESRCAELGIQLPLHDEIVFIKSNMADEGYAGGYTHKNEIYLDAYFLGLAVRASQGEFSDMDREYFLHFTHELVAHEIFHVLTRGDAQFRQRMYGLVGFTVMDHEVEFGPAVRGVLESNPDVERYDNYAEFTIGGVKRPCILTAVYTSSYAEAVVIDSEANFFNYTEGVLIPLDEPNTMIPIEQATDFYDIMGYNSNYLLAAEEYLADNFSYLVAYGLDGRYDFDRDQDCLVFIPYPTPQLISSIHNMLTQYYANK